MPRWRNPRELGIEPMYPDLECEPPLDDEVATEYRGGTSFVAGQAQGPRLPRSTPPLPGKPRIPWAAPGGELERVLRDLAVPAWCAIAIRDSLRSTIVGARIHDRRADAEWGDVVKEWIGPD